MIVVTGGATARFSIEVYDSSDVAVTGLVNGGFTKFLSTNGATDATSVTVTEVASGEYTVTFTAPVVAAGARSLCRCRITHATYAKRGWAQTFLVVNADVLAGTAALAANDVADAILKRDVDQVEATAAIHSLCSVILNHVSKLDGATGKTYRTDGITVHMTRAVTTDSGADPISALGVAT